MPTPSPSRDDRTHPEATASRWLEDAWASRHHDLERTARLSLEAQDLAERLGDARALGHAARNLGFVAMRRSQYDEAAAQLTRGLEAARAVGDAALEGDCLCYSAMVSTAHARYLEALETQWQALAIRERLEDIAGQGQSLGSLGVIYGNLFDFAASLEHHRRALELRERAGDEHGRALTLNNIGVAYFEMEDPQTALEYHTRALEVARALGNASVETYALINRGADLEALGRHSDANREHADAMVLARERGDIESLAEATCNAGRSALSLGEHSAALGLYDEALQLARSMNSPVLEYMALAGMGRVYLDQGDLQRAIGELRAALEIARRRGLKRDVFRTHGLLADALEGAGNFAGALAHHRAFYAVEREAQNERAEARAKTLALQFETERVRREAALERQRSEDLSRVNAALVKADTEKSALMEQLEHQARHDALTGLPNRALFADRLERTVRAAARYGRELAVLFVDLDGFKLVNDTLGHHAGDALLIEVSRRLEYAVRESDTVARMGGDEFTIVLSEVLSSADAARVAGRIVHSLEAPMKLPGSDTLVNVTASVGVSVYPRDGLDAETLSKHADLALYRAKEEGKNGVRFFAPDMNAAAVERLQIESALRGALERSEFSLHYQPIQAAHGAHTFEALLRWTHPTLGRIAPDRFIPSAEDSGLIVTLGAWVLNEALRQVGAWRAGGASDVRVAVNVSPVQLARDDFVTTVADALKRHNLEGDCLELELTERVIVRDLERTSARLTALRDLGVGLSVDDFGAGHSSLAYLMRLPVDTLKIDRSFVAAVDAGETRVVGAIVALAHALGLGVVAEGVETGTQLETLKALGCERFQGYFLGRPAPASDAQGWLEGQPSTHKP
jgi:diguanylate cyclase (GGDEF)-like protein